MRRYSPIFLLACSLLLAFICYRPGLYGDFLFDDNINIVENGALKIYTLDFDSLKSAAVSMGNSLAGRPLSMASFALDYYFNGPGPYGFKLTNLIIHLLNGICIFILTTLVLGIHCRRHAPELSAGRLGWIALAVASAWLLHPLNLTGVLYVVQRMASLSALFTLSGLIFYLYGRKCQLDGRAGWGWILPAFFLFTPLALLSKETGALLPAFMLLAELILLNFEAPAARSRRILIALFTFAVGLPLLALAGYALWNPNWILVGYGIRDFTLPERLMTEARVLWFYLRLILVPDISQLGMYHDDIVISRGLLTPWMTLFACLGIALLVAVAVWLRRRHPLVAFGVLFFLLGHSIESTVIALEIAHEHRNYLPDYGILLVLFHYLLSPGWLKDTVRLRRVLVLVLILFFGGITALRAGQWASEYELKLMEVAHHPDSPRANAEVAYLYAFMPGLSAEQTEEYRQLAFSHYHKAAELSSSDTSGLFGLLGLSAMRGEQIEEGWVKQLEYLLEHRPVPPAAINSLMHLEKCLTGGICKHSPQVMARLLTASLRNKGLSGKRRGNVQFAWSNLLFVALHRPEQAFDAARKALAASPNEPETRITFIKFMLNQGHPDEALKQIAMLRQIDGLKIYGAQLDELEKLATMQEQKLH
jgi:hypothetical protein